MAPAAGSFCYTGTNDFVNLRGDYAACGTSSSGVTQCCHSGDSCLQDGICYTGTVANNQTGYYLGGCTDPTYQDPTCQKTCLSEYSPDIVYNITQDKWFCCDDHGSLDCQHPSIISIDAPAPSAIATVGSIGVITTKIPDSSIGVYNATQSTPTKVSSRSNDALPEALSSSTTMSGSALSSSAGSSLATSSAMPSAQATDQGLSGGAIAGIVIGVLAVIAILAVLLAILHKKRKRRQELEATIPAKQSRYYAELPNQRYAKPPIQQPQEMEASGSPREMATMYNSPFANMPARGSPSKYP